MPRLFAFLRAINVGGHTVTMAELCRLFEGLGFKGVETFIASGNVSFTSRSRAGRAAEERIEKCLHASLGFEVATFIRTDTEVAAIARYRPFSAAQLRGAGAFSVGFLTEPLGAPAIKALMALKTEIDNFRVHGRELYWLCQKKQSESLVSNAVFERTLRVRATFRNVNTVSRLAAKYALIPAPPSGAGAAGLRTGEAKR